MIARLDSLPLRRVRPAVVIHCGVDPSRAQTEPLIVFTFDRAAFIAGCAAALGGSP